MLMQLGSEERELTLPSLNGWDADVQLWVDWPARRSTGAGRHPRAAQRVRGGASAEQAAVPPYLPCCCTGAGARPGAGIDRSVLIRPLGRVGVAQAILLAVWPVVEGWIKHPSLSLLPLVSCANPSHIARMSHSERLPPRVSKVQQTVV